MKARVRVDQLIGTLLLAAAFAVMGWQLVQVYLSGMRHVTHGLLLAAAVCAPLALGAWLYTRALDRPQARRTVRALFFALFVFYAAVLLGALIVSRIDYRGFAQTRAFYWENIDRMTNFIPFETVRLYLNAIKYNYIGMEIPLSNLAGNAMLFMPMAVFLPCLFRPMRSLWRFVLTMLLLLVAVEALQLLFACGSCDVDDVLLNLAGTLIVFGILKIPLVRRPLERLYLMPAPDSAEGAPPDATA